MAACDNLGGAVLIICYIWYFKCFFKQEEIPLYNETIVLNSIKNQESPVFKDLTYKKDTLRVSIIGDSYALRQGYRRSLLEDCLKQKVGKIPIYVEIASLGGRQSDSLLHGCNTQFRDLISKRPDYCVVLGGVNDVFKADCRKSPDYYAHNMMQIIKCLADNNISTIILEIPYIWIGKDKIQRLLIPYCKQDEYIEKYRVALKDSLIVRNFGNCYLLNADSWSQKGDHSIFEDPVHLNDNGYVQLDLAIASIISKEITNKKQIKR